VSIIPFSRPLKPEFLYLRTNGWKSGMPHEIEIWYVSHNGSYYLVAEYRERAHWVQNLLHNPAVTFHVESKTHQGVGRIVDRSAEPELASAVAALMDAKYGWSDDLIVELRPEQSD
jgi:deazaflavin-dependent oxidoreductase (nitroreductase family)